MHKFACLNKKVQYSLYSNRYYNKLKSLFDGSLSIFVAAVIAQLVTGIINSVAPNLFNSADIVLSFFYAFLIANTVAYTLAINSYCSHWKLYKFWFRVSVENVGFAWQQTASLILIKYTTIHIIYGILSWFLILITTITLFYISSIIQYHILSTNKKNLRKILEFESEAYALSLAYTFNFLVAYLLYGPIVNNGGILNNTDDYTPSNIDSSLSLVSYRDNRIHKYNTISGISHTISLRIWYTSILDPYTWIFFVYICIVTVFAAFLEYTISQHGNFLFVEEEEEQKSGDICDKRNSYTNSYASNTHAYAPTSNELSDFTVSYAHINNSLSEPLIAPDSPSYPPKINSTHTPDTYTLKHIYTTCISILYMTSDQWHYFILCMRKYVTVLIGYVVGCGWYFWTTFSVEVRVVYECISLCMYMSMYQ